MSRPLRILGIAVILLTYFVMAPVGYSGFLIWSLVPTGDPAARRRRFQRILHVAFRSLHALLRAARIHHFDPREVRGGVPTGPCLLVANHPSLVDVSALLATIDPLVFPVKSTLFHRPWVAPLLRTAGAFEGPGLDRSSVARFVERIEARLRSGDRVLVFPEGTRSKDELPDPFGRAAFEAAQRAGVPVVPICIRSVPRWLGRDSRFLDPPARLVRLEIDILSAEPAAEPGSSSRALRDIVFQRIRAELEARATQSEAAVEHLA